MFIQLSDCALTFNSLEKDNEQVGQYCSFHLESSFLNEHLTFYIKAKQIKQIKVYRLKL